MKISKRAVDRAGDILRNEAQNEEALAVLDQWRATFAEPLTEAVETVRELCPQELFKRVSHRLKRSVSIIEKLKRQPEMKLSRMQDIAGLRWVVKSELNTEFLCEILSEKFNIIRQYDYNSKPKASGYSAYHVVLGFPEKRYKDFQFELQIRTYRRHLWAMAVETAGMFYGEALKASQGNQDWLEFFKRASAAVSHIEHRRVMQEYADKSEEEIRNELKDWGTKKTFFSKLAAIKGVRELFPGKKYDYWLLELNIKKSENRIYGFKTTQLETAMAMYAAKEQTPACLRGDVQVVLVSTRRFQDLRQAYPSYFLDVRKFIQMLKEFCSR